MRTSLSSTVVATLLGAAAGSAWAAALPPGAPLDGTGRLPSANQPLAVPPMRPVGTKTGLAGALLAVGTNSVMAHTAHAVPNGTTGLQLCFSGSYLSPAEGASVNSVYVAAGATVVAGGSGYAVGDAIVSAATGANRAITARVAQVASGAVTKVNIEDGGLFIAQLPDGTAQASTTGAGTGATFATTWTPYAYAVRVGVEPVFSGGGVAASSLTGANAIRQAVMGAPRAVGSKLYASSDILVPSGGWVCTDTVPIPAVANGAPIGLRTWMYGSGGVLVAPTGVSSRAISAMSESGTTVTATLPTGTSDLVVGRTMAIANAVPAGYNGAAYTIASIPDANTVTFTAAAGLGAVTTPGLFGTVSGSTYVSPGSNGTDYTVSGTIPAPTGASGAYGPAPAAILGNVYTPSVCIVGDSRTYGSAGAGLYDFPGDANDNHGWLQRALGNKVPFVNFAFPGNQLGYLMGTQYGRAAQLNAIKRTGCSNVAVILDVNDFGSGGLSAATLLPLEAQLAAELHAIPTVKRVFTATGTPDVGIAGSTQTVASACANLEARNASLRNAVSATGAVGSASPYFGIYDFMVDAAATVESGTTCTWSNLANTGDGLHPSSPLGHATIAAGVQATLLQNLR